MLSALLGHPRSLWLLVLPLLLVIHVVKTGRDTMWIWVIVVGSYIGALAYVIVEILPELTRGRAARQARSVLRDAVDPNRDLRSAQLNLRINDSVDSRRKVADELFARGKLDEALEHYQAARSGIYTHDPLLVMGVAQVQFAKQQFDLAAATLRELYEYNRDFKSGDCRLLYGRTLEATGDNAQAMRQYELATRTAVGTEAAYRLGSLLIRSGQVERGREMLRDLVNKAELSNSAYRREQRQWIDLANRELLTKQ